MTVTPRRPDFFVLGAPKCGTTSLYSYLAQSPHVYVPPKELHHFGADLPFSLPTPSRAEYEAYFQAAGNRTVGDVDVWYMYSRTAAGEIKAYAPNARLIMMLRNPVDFMYSLHSQAVFSNEETERSFEKALRLEPARLRGERMPPWAHARHAVFYRDLARFASQIQRYLDSFPAENIHFILLDDLSRQPSQEWARVCEFLRIPADGVTDFGVVNPNKVNRWARLAWLDGFFRRGLVPSLGLDRLPAIVKSLAKKALMGVERFNTRFEPRQKMDPELRSSLLAEFEVEFQALESILQRDLSVWRG